MGFKTKVKQESKEEIEEVESFNPLAEELLINLQERVTATINQNGEYESYSHKGTLCLFIDNPSLERFLIKTDFCKLPGMTFKLPPNFDKKL